MRALLVAVALVLSPVAALAQTLTVTNAEGKVTTFSPEALAALPRAEARLGGKTAYDGVSLSAVLREAGVPQGPRLHGKPMQAFVVVTGKDGYRAVLSIAETDPSFRDSAIIIAERHKGRFAAARRRGPLRLVIDADAPARSRRAPGGFRDGGGRALAVAPARAGRQPERCSPRSWMTLARPTIRSSTSPMRAGSLPV
jgi:hypothetical protein